MRKSQEDFIQQAKAKHGEKYNYDKVVYKTTNTKVQIFCKKCKQFFWQSPYNHLRGQACPYCAGHVKLTQERFVEKAQLIHGNNFDYSKVNYINNKTKIYLRCKKCDTWFWQLPGNHLRGLGCQKCSRSCPSTTEQFIKKAQAIHGNNFNYDSVVYKNNKTKVQIFCNKCKKFFWQAPCIHLSGAGCMNCAIEKRRKLRLKTTDQFIEEAKNKHGECYDYSLVDYKRDNIKVKIICKQCGSVFLQTPDKHLHGNCGCPKCSKSRGEKSARLWLEKNNVKFIMQKRFADCKDIKPLPFDFYLPDYNICLEFQGFQHYEKGLDYFKIKIKDEEKAIKAYTTQLKHDEMKRAFCIKKKIKLIEIKYSDNIEKRMKEILEK